MSLKKFTLSLAALVSLSFLVACSFGEHATKRLRLAKEARESVNFFSDIMSPFF